MMDTIRRLILLASVVSMPFVIGCFGAGSSNPVGTAPLAQVDGSVVAQADNPAIAAAKFLSNPTSSKKSIPTQNPHVRCPTNTNQSCPSAPVPSAFVSVPIPRLKAFSLLWMI